MATLHLFQLEISRQKVKIATKMTQTKPLFITSYKKTNNVAFNFSAQVLLPVWIHVSRHSQNFQTCTKHIVYGHFTFHSNVVGLLSESFYSLCLLLYENLSAHFIRPPTLVYIEVYYPKLSGWSYLSSLFAPNVYISNLGLWVETLNMPKAMPFMNPSHLPGYVPGPGLGPVPILQIILFT